MLDFHNACSLLNINMGVLGHGFTGRQKLQMLESLENKLERKNTLRDILFEQLEAGNS